MDADKSRFSNCAAPASPCLPVSLIFGRNFAAIQNMQHDSARVLRLQYQRFCLMLASTIDEINAQGSAAVGLDPANTRAAWRKRANAVRTAGIIDFNRVYPLLAVVDGCDGHSVGVQFMAAGKGGTEQQHKKEPANAKLEIIREHNNSLDENYRRRARLSEARGKSAHQHATATNPVLISCARDSYAGDEVCAEA